MTPSEKVDEDMRRVLYNCCLDLMKSGIRLLALDFDHTICSIHTGGGFIPSGALRPIFVALLQEAQKCGLKTCIVTFHSKEDKVQSCVTEEAELEEPIIVRGAYHERSKDSPSGGKLPHIFSSWKAIFPDEEISWKQVLLIDDDRLNVSFAKDHGIPGIHLNPDSETKVFLKQLTSLPSKLESSFCDYFTNTFRLCSC